MKLNLIESIGQFATFVFLTFHVSFLYLQKSLYRKYLRRVCQDWNENLVGWTVTVRNFAENTWGRRTSVLSLGPNSAAEIETRLGDLGLCGDFHATRGGALDRERWTLGRQISLLGNKQKE